MKFIEEDNWNMFIYLVRIINKEEENIIVNIDGKEIWESYKDLLVNNFM